MRRYLFANVCANLRANGGEVETFVHLIRTPGQDTSGERRSYDDATITLDLTIPFTFSGEQLCVVARGAYCAEEPWSCFTLLHRRAKIEMALDEATQCAMERAKEDIARVLKKTRPTATDRKIRRKTDAVMKLLTQQKKEK